MEKKRDDNKWEVTYDICATPTHKRVSYKTSYRCRAEAVLAYDFIITQIAMGIPRAVETMYNIWLRYDTRSVINYRAEKEIVTLFDNILDEPHYGKAIEKILALDDQEYLDNFKPHR